MTHWQFGPFPYALITSGIFSFILFIILLRSRKEPLARLLALGLLAEAEWSIVVGLEAATVYLPLKILLSKISYWGVYNCVPLFLLFTIHYVGLSEWVTPRKIIIMWTAPVIMIVLACTNEYHHLIWSGFVPTGRSGDSVMIFLRGPVYWLGVVNNYIMLIAITILMYWKMTKSTHSIYRRQSFLMLSSALPPWLANFIYVIEWEPIKGMDFTPIAFSFTGFLIFISLYYYRLLDLSPVARDTLFERIKDAILVLDKQNRLVDMNTAAEKLLGVDRKLLIGQLASESLKTFPSLVQSLSEKKDMQMEISLSGTITRDLEVNNTQLYSPNGERVGKLITFQEITARKQAEEKEREGRLLAEALRDVTMAVTSTLNISEVLDRLLEYVYSVLPCNMTNIVLIDEDGLGRVAHYRGYVDPGVIDWLKTVTFDIDEVYSYRYMDETGQALIVPDTHAVDYWKIKDDTLRSYLGAPIRVKGETVGFLNLDHNQVGFYHAEHAKRLQAFASLAAIALENARLFDKVNELATHDGLTGINNRRHFFNLATIEIQRAVRYNIPLSLLIIDIDRFKQVNDTFGHQLGDVTLQKLAGLFQTVVRDIDISGRYGGDEFCLLMPETDAQDALKAAERLLEAIRGLEIPTSQGVQHITVSIGIATLFEKQISFDDLLQQADEALYVAKQKGRDRIEVYGGENS
jgi:diguanylate cyclase (GGDEF)-like protein/PAS domain S-box-containing protein